MKKGLEKVSGFYRNRNILSNIIEGKGKNVNKDIECLIDLKMERWGSLCSNTFGGKNENKFIGRKCVCAQVYMCVWVDWVSEAARDLMNLEVWNDCFRSESANTKKFNGHFGCLFEMMAIILKLDRSPLLQVFV